MSVLAQVYLTTLIFLLIYSYPLHTFAKSSKPQSLTAATLEYPPYEYSVDGQARGIAVEIIKEATRRTGVNQVSFNFYPWKRAVYSAQNGDSDMLFNAGKNEQRARWGQYSKSTLILQKYVLFKKRDTNIDINKDFSNVKPYSIAIRLGYLYGSGPFRQTIDNHRFASVELSHSTQQSINMLLGDRVDMLVGDYLPVMHYIKSNQLQNQIDIIKDSQHSPNNRIVLTWPTYMLFNKKNIPNSYIEELDRAMEQMEEDGFIDAVFEKYN